MCVPECACMCVCWRGGKRGMCVCVSVCVCQSLPSDPSRKPEVALQRLGSGELKLNQNSSPAKHRILVASEVMGLHSKILKSFMARRNASFY